MKINPRPAMPLIALALFGATTMLPAFSSRAAARAADERPPAPNAASPATPLRCVKCHQSLEPQLRFCRNCGTETDHGQRLRAVDFAEQAADLLRADLPEKAAQLARQAVALDTDNADAHAVLGSALIEQRQADAGEQALREALRRDPENTLAGAGTFLLAALTHRDSDAEQNFARLYTVAPVEKERLLRRAIELAPGWPWPVEQLAARLVARENFADAVGLYYQMVQLNSQEGLYHADIARCLIRLNQREAATLEARQAILLGYNAPHPAFEMLQIQPDVERATLAAQAALRGITLVRQGKTNEGEQELQSAMKLYPGCAAAHAGFGVLHERAHRPDKAKEFYAAALRLDPNNVIACNNLGYLLLLEENDTARAEPLLQRAHRLDESSARPVNGLAIVHYQEKDFAEAERLYEEAIRLDPSDSWPVGNLGTLRFTVDPTDPKAAELFQQAIGLDSSDPWPVHNLGVYYLARRDYPEAERCFREAIRLQPDRAEFQASLAECLRRRQSREEKSKEKTK